MVRTSNKKADRIAIFVLIGLALLAIGGSVFSNYKENKKNYINEQKEKIDDYKNSTIGIITGSSFETLTKEKFPNATYKYLDNVSDVAYNLSIGKIDAYLLDDSTFSILFDEYKYFGYVEESVGSVDYGTMFSSTVFGNELKKEYNVFLGKCKQSGFIEELKDKWINEVDDTKKIVDYTLPKNPKKIINFACTSQVQPFCYYKNNNFVGFDIDLLFNFCREYNYGVVISDGAISSLTTGISTGIYDMVSCALSITEERKATISFSDPYYTTNIYLVINYASNSYYANHPEEIKEISIFESIKDSFYKNFIKENRFLMIINGMVTTLIITAGSAILGLAISFIIVLLRRLNSKVINKVCDIYVRILQGTPNLVLLMILFYVVFGNAGIGPIVVSIIAFGLCSGAFVSEIFINAINSISIGQREAYLALGYKESQGFFRFLMPQAILRFLPVYKGELVSLLKGTSIVGYIAIQDLTKASDIIRSLSYDAFFPLIVSALIYLLLSWLIILLIDSIKINIDPKTIRRKKEKEEKLND